MFAGCADVDVVYTHKPVWESFLAFVAIDSADGVCFENDGKQRAGIQRKGLCRHSLLRQPTLQCDCWSIYTSRHSVLSAASRQPDSSALRVWLAAAGPGGGFLMLPTPAAAAFMTNWSSSAVEGIKQNQDDQKNVQRLNSHAYHCCQNSGCFKHVRNQVRSARRPLPVQHGRLCRVGVAAGWWGMPTAKAAQCTPFTAVSKGQQGRAGALATHPALWAGHGD